MQVTINGTAHEIPFTLADIKLGEFIAYYEQYGQDLDKELDEIHKAEYSEEGFDQDDIELHKEIALDSHIDKEAIAWFCFWTKLEFYEVKEHPSITPFLFQYRLFRNLLNYDMQGAYNFLADIEWNGKTYCIQNYTVNNASQMTFNEVITSKEIVRQIQSLGKGRWSAMPYLCAVFFRQKVRKAKSETITKKVKVAVSFTKWEKFKQFFTGKKLPYKVIEETTTVTNEVYEAEDFTDEMVNEENLKLMEQLPMSYTLMVAFFLNTSVIIWKSISAYSAERVEEIASLN